MDSIDWRHLFIEFDGRINRAKAWFGYIMFVVVSGLAGQIFGNFSTIAGLISLLLLWPLLAVAIKRWHDRDKSGWWVLIGLIPVIGWIWVLVELGFLPGTDGPNQYGPDPLAGTAPEAA